ncbi:MAG: hypothetical protein V1793_08930 [Pseudomonadota bacterium]
MINIVLASGEIDRFSAMVDALNSHGIKVTPVHSGALALSMISNGSCDVLIADELLPDMTGKVLITKTVARNPFINCVAVSKLSHEDFHEEYEGMGVLMQFPPTPAPAEVENLLNHLDKIASLSKK